MSQIQKEYFKETEHELICSMIPTLDGNTISEMRMNLFNTIAISFHDEDYVDYLISEYLADKCP